MKYLASILALVLALGLLGCGQQPAKPKALTVTPPVPAQVKPQSETLKPVKTDTGAAAPAVQNFTQAPPVMKFTGTPYLTINIKGYGPVKIKLDPQAAPLNVSNVYQLAKAGFYDGLTFHRIIKDFMMQGGDPTGTGTGGPPYTVPAELKLKNARGAVAMARTNNPEKASSSCQFYILFKDAPFLDQAGYTVIGNVVSGMDVIDKIADVPTKMGGDNAMSSPITPVVMEKVSASQE